MRGCIIRVTKAALVPPFFSPNELLSRRGRRASRISLVFSDCAAIASFSAALSRRLAINSLHRPAEMRRTNGFKRPSFVPERSRVSRSVELLPARLRGVVPAAASRALMSSRNASYSEEVSTMRTFIPRGFPKRINVRFDSPCPNPTRLTLGFPWSSYPFSLDISIKRPRLTELRTERTKSYPFAFSDERADQMHRDPVSWPSFCIAQ